MLTVSELIRVLRFEQSIRDYDARKALGRPLDGRPSGEAPAEPLQGPCRGEHDLEACVRAERGAGE